MTFEDCVKKDYWYILTHTDTNAYDIVSSLIEKYGVNRTQMQKMLPPCEIKDIIPESLDATRHLLRVPKKKGVLIYRIFNGVAE